MGKREWIAYIPDQSGFEWFDDRGAAESYAVATMTELLNYHGEAHEDRAWVAVIVSQAEEVVEQADTGPDDYVIDRYQMEPTGYTASRLEELADAVADATAPLRAEIARLQAEAAGDESTARVLVRPGMMRRIQSLGLKPGSGHIVGWMVDEIERQRAEIDLLRTEVERLLVIECPRPGCGLEDGAMGTRSANDLDSEASVASPSIISSDREESAKVRQTDGTESPEAPAEAPACPEQPGAAAWVRPAPGSARHGPYGLPPAWLTVWLADMLDALAEHALDCDQQPAHRARPGRVGSCTWCDFLERYERAFPKSVGLPAPAVSTEPNAESGEALPEHLPNAESADEVRSLYCCVMCPSGAEWIGDYDAGNLFGECPSCHYGVGIFKVTPTFPAEGTATRRHLDEVISASSWERLDLSTAPSADEVRHG